MANQIARFDGPHRFLSNFFPAVVVLDGETYPTVEHAYQAAKTLNLSERLTIRDAWNAGEAKRRGRRVTMRSDWDGVRIGVMRGLLQQKFAHPELAARLRRTDDAVLVEGNTWGDTFWGVCRGRGENWLGRLLTEVRDGQQA